MVLAAAGGQGPVALEIAGAICAGAVIPVAGLVSLFIFFMSEGHPVEAARRFFGRVDPTAISQAERGASAGSDGAPKTGAPAAS
jgi:hypothetical protein